MPMIARSIRARGPLLAMLTLLIAGLIIWAPPAYAQTYGTCTVAPSTIDLGDMGSYTVASTAAQGSGASGLSCTTLLTLAATSYIKVKLEGSTFLLTGPGNQTIPFSLSSTSGGAALAIGNEVDFSTTALLTLFSGPSNSIPLYVRTSPTTGLAAGTYSGTVTLRWYFSVCTLGGLGVLCVTSSDSPGFSRNALGGLANWGTGVPVSVNVTLDVLPDCQITAPNLTFGSAPLVGSFNTVTRTISVRCSKNSSYTVGLNNGMNFTTTRRMRLGATTNYLNYEIYRGTSTSSGRWGSAIPAERRSSAAADINPGTYDSSTLQGFTYSAAVDAGQTTPVAGSYIDTIIVDIAF